jgi:hypothetical protein
VVRLNSKDFPSLVAHARRVLVAARPTIAHVLRILDALNDDEIRELGKDQPDEGRREAILRRLAKDLGEHPQIIDNVLRHRLRLDLQDNSDAYVAAEQNYRKSGVADSEIEQSLYCFNHRNPHAVSFVFHCMVTTWAPGNNDLTTLIIEDDAYATVCKGYLVAKGLVFPDSVELLETSMQQGWPHWQSLWRYF